MDGYVVCVGYADALRRSLVAWRDGLDSLIVATTPDDEATIDLCRSASVATHETRRFYFSDAAFNKSGAVDEMLVAAAPAEWVLLLDADVVPPAGWRVAVESARPTPGILHVATRVDVVGRPYHDSDQVPGFFQLWHAADARWTSAPRLGDWRSASAYDSELMSRWPAALRRTLPVVLTHLGDPGRNWCGVGGEAACARLHAERARRGGWGHERIAAK